MFQWGVGVRGEYILEIVKRVKDVRTQKFPRTDFFKTLTAGKKMIRLY